MAKDVAKIKFTADTAEFNAQIKQANSSLSALRAGLKLNEAEFKNTGDKAQYLTNKHQILEAELEQNRAKQDALTQKLEAAETAYGKDSTEAQKLATQLTNVKVEEQNLIGAVQQCDRELDEMSDTVSEADRSMDQLGDSVKESSDAANQASNDGWTKFDQIISDLATQAIDAAIGKLKELADAMISTGIGFTESMSNVEAISGASGDQLEALESKARELGSSTQFSASEVADAFGYMAMAGWDTQSMIEGIDGVLQLAASSGTDLAKTSDIVTDGLSAMGYSASDAGRLADVMAAASSNANTNVEMMGESFKYVAPVAGAMGYSMEDLSVALGVMANAGIKSSSAGTSLRTLLTNMAKPTDTMSAAMDTLGVSLDDGNGNMKSFREVLGDLRNGFGDIKMSQEDFNSALADLDTNLENGSMSEEEYSSALADLIDNAYGAEGALKANAAASLAGKTGMSGLLALVNASPEEFDALTAAIDNSDGSAQNMADTMNNNLGGDIKELNSAIEEFQLKIYEDLEQPMRDVVGFVTGSVIPAASEAYEWMTQHQTLIATLGAIIGVLAVAVGAHAAVQAIKVAMDAAEVTSLGGLIAAKYASAAASMAALAPYVLIVAAIAAVIAIIVLCVTHWDQIKAKVREVAQNVSAKVGEMKTNISNKFSEIKSSISNKWSEIKSDASNKISEIKSTAKNKFDEVKEGIMEPIRTAKEKISGFIDDIKGFFDGLKLKIPKPEIPSLPTITLETSSKTIMGKTITYPTGFDIDWHAEGAIFNVPTIIPTLRGLHGVGEAGPEAVAPIRVLMDYVQIATERAVRSVTSYIGIDYDKLADKLSDACSKMETVLEVDSREVGRAKRRRPA